MSVSASIIAFTMIRGRRFGASTSDGEPHRYRSLRRPGFIAPKWLSVRSQTQPKTENVFSEGPRRRRLRQVRTIPDLSQYLLTKGT